MKKIYFFDFDGTLTYKDTMFLYLKFCNPQRFYQQFIFHIPLFILLKLKLAEAEKIKKSLIFNVLKNETKESLEKKSKKFFETNFPDIIRENALDFIQNIDRKNTESFIVTASLDIWVKPFAEHFKMELLATQAEFSNDKLTGNFIGANCNKEEKVHRIKEAIANKKFDKTIAFGDTSGDSAMLKWANESHFKFFH